jgi:DNA repair ATPase RecN
MDATAVQHAITALKAQGGRVSVRAIHAKIGGSFRDIHRLLRDVAAEGDEVEADDEVAGGPAETSRPLTPLQRAQDAARALDARAQGLQATEEAWLRQRRDLQQTMAQARQAHDLDTLATLLTREPALAQLLSHVQSEKREVWTAVQAARAGVQQVYREASPTAAQYLAVRARIQALQQAMHHHGRELTRCQAELPRHQQQLDALGRELRETWGVEEPT